MYNVYPACISRSDMEKNVGLTWFHELCSLLQVYIMHAQMYLYVAEIDGKLLMKIGKAKYEPDSTTWKPLQTGRDWGVWRRD